MLIIELPLLQAYGISLLNKRQKMLYKRVVVPPRGRVNCNIWLLRGEKSKAADLPPKPFPGSSEHS